MVRTWGSSERRSEGLRNLVTLDILACGGLHHWASLAPQFNIRNAVATEEKRAQLVGKCLHPPWALAKYPPPYVQKREPSQSGDLGPSGNSKEELLSDSGIGNDADPHHFHNMSCFFKLFDAPQDDGIFLEPHEYASSALGRKYWGEFVRTMNVWLQLLSMKRLNDILDWLYASVVMSDDIQDGTETFFRAPFEVRHWSFTGKSTPNVPPSMKASVWLTVKLAAFYHTLFDSWKLKLA
ncbi:hypothetical protein BDV38DRAFT_279257 [Aspergillus pseudotamarii]|uniref:Uncharacterized protein n=1 Tax=Aspergillus pseudotamarii TaxID=132259 RepID=A0A5N6T4W9_ASPPS|nr:uncharacterized protein BDV38DRAFT_279257 [Aspergillus pseudotamarii]KAE8141356.1 hypothetical protein BDV38DRAFT_279257 [Aspergillus pseudotamarii]